MTDAEKLQAFSERIRPHLEEIGIRAFAIAAYMEDGEGKCTRVTMGGNGGNPAFEDGLRTLQTLMARWGQGQL